MKKAITALIAIMASVPAFSQTDSLMDISAKGSELRIEAAGFGITIGGPKPEFTKPYGKERHSPKRITTSLLLCSFDLGFNVLSNIDYSGKWSGMGDYLNMNGWKSVRFGWEFASIDIALDRRRNCEFSLGLKLTADNYTFAEPYTLKANDDGMLIPHELDGYIKKSKLTTCYIGIPVSFNFRLSDCTWLSVYATGDLLVNAHTKYKKPRTKAGISGITTWRATAGACLSFHNIGFFCDYGITPIFARNAAPDTHSIALGLRIGI